MIEKNFLQNYARKQETGFDNVLREYVQHLFLRNFYTKLDSKDFLFKGGTALKLVFGSPKFSEDLDFTGIQNSVSFEEILEDCLFGLSSEGVKIDLIESKPTSGGHIAIIKLDLFGGNVQIQNQISFRKLGQVESENVVVTSNLVPTYNVYILERGLIVAEKVNALIERAKPRDFFDFYFILRDQGLKKYLNIDEEQRKKIITNLENQDKHQLGVELKRLLPKSYWSVVKDLPSALRKEMI